MNILVSDLVTILPTRLTVVYLLTNASDLVVTKKLEIENEPIFVYNVWLASLMQRYLVILD